MVFETNVLSTELGKMTYASLLCMSKTWEKHLIQACHCLYLWLYANRWRIIWAILSWGMDTSSPEDSSHRTCFRDGICSKSLASVMDAWQRSKYEAIIRFFLWGASLNHNVGSPFLTHQIIKCTNQIGIPDICTGKSTSEYFWMDAAWQVLHEFQAAVFM